MIATHQERDAKMNFVIWLLKNVLPAETWESSRKAFAILLIIWLTLSLISRMDTQVLHSAHWSFDSHFLRITKSASTCHLEETQRIVQNDRKTSREGCRKKMCYLAPETCSILTPPHTECSLPSMNRNKCRQHDSMSNVRRTMQCAACKAGSLDVDVRQLAYSLKPFACSSRHYNEGAMHTANKKATKPTAESRGPV
ncbi:hypothetical protein T265_12017 [Opisthorchis viverrini]|uniref:Uncharacterized protein n=1 Tax=Opisthorchis viverrini TaxID=6198 RepID=A0A074ZV67_OPIVI|nr:hypothetical protein T265_12017 [Opisthorchis viverrini]KER19084.1 hypothetical protein T265_12017 [Opisthorchis viverrini]